MGVIEIASRADPEPGEFGILVRVRAVGLNRADLLQCAGKYPAPPGWPADIPGLEYAGEVEALGLKVTRWKVGDRVMGLVGGGAHAERLTVHEAEVLRIPDGMSFTDAAALPEAFLTAWDAIVLRARAKRGDRIVVHTIGSGVGTAAAQLGRALGLEIIGTSRSPDKLARARALGMVRGVLMAGDSWPADVGGPVQAIIDTLGAKAFEQNLGLLAARGRLVLLGTLTGAQAGGVDLGRMLRARLEVIGTAMRIRSLDERTALVERFQRAVMPMFAGGMLKPVVDRVLAMQDLAAAHRAMQANETFGKIVLAW